ncbi:MAG TPA: methylmalonyl-CoA mutase family protein, partial [Chloroflexota bacterium]|nr:methylmalonyl-CoA mutase family protein [Chloroflexota bacterium]
TNGWDEALAIPSEHAMRLALRTQQIILDETGAANTIDPMAGSYFVEQLTDRIEQGARDYLRRIEELGGTVAAVEQSFQQREIADAAFDYQRRKEQQELTVVGVNRYQDPLAESEEAPFTLHAVEPEVEARQIERVRSVRARRDQATVDAALEALRQAARSDETTVMSPTLEAVRARATGGEIVNALKDVFGRYIEAPVF